MSVAINRLLRELHSGESELEWRLLAAADRHRTEHEVHHVTTDLARWSRENARALAALAGTDGSLFAHLKQWAATNDVTAAIRQRAATLIGRRPEPGLLLLHDVRALYVLATRNSVNWTMLGQAAQASRDSRLLSVVSECHPRTLRQVKWCNAILKETAPQILVTS
jgi:hypothetical protein